MSFKKILRFFTVMSFCHTQNMYSQAIPYQTIPYIKNIQPYIQRHSLIAFDIDLTLLVPNQSVGMPQWVKHRQEHLLRSYSDRQEAYDRLVADFSAVYNLVGFHPAEKDTAHFLASLRKENTPYIGLTARSHSLLSATRIHLQDNGLKFNSPLFHKQDQNHNHKKTYVLPPSPQLHHQVAIDRGIVYASGQHKGMVLEHTLQTAGYPLKHLIFIDDEPHNLHKVAETCQNSGWHCDLFLYTGTKSQSDSFNIKLANQEWEKIHSKIRLPNS